MENDVSYLIKQLQLFHDATHHQIHGHT